jgi:hypothetical protein
MEVDAIAAFSIPIYLNHAAQFAYLFVVYTAIIQTILDTKMSWWDFYSNAC